MRAAIGPRAANDERDGLTGVPQESSCERCAIHPVADGDTGTETSQNPTVDRRGKIRSCLLINGQIHQLHDVLLGAGEHK